jgi:hypothetical protein
MIAFSHTRIALMRLSRRSWLAGLVAGLLALRTGRQAAAATPPDDDPILLVDGWILRRSDLDLLNDRQDRRRDP